MGDNFETNEAFIELLQADVRKVLITFSHEEILKCMENFHPFLIKVVESFLSERKQKTKYKNQLSNTTTLTCGISQGTKLGPTLFLLLCNMIATWHKVRRQFNNDSTTEAERNPRPTGNGNETRVRFLSKKFTINRMKSEIIRISFLKPRVPDLHEEGIPVAQKLRILVVIFNDRLT